jgi:hypothetical protein
VSRRRVLLLAAAAACLAASALLALLAADVRTWQRTVEDGGVAAVDSAGSALWQADTTLPFGAARRLLAIDDDIAFRRAVALFRRAHAPAQIDRTASNDVRVTAQTALARIVHSDGNRRRASAAGNLLGVLALIDATSGATGSATPIERSVFELQDAVRLDRDNEQAKANLELVYQVASGQATVRGGAGRTGGPRTGATVATAGHGY